jgi:hypothetical protein
MVDKMRELKKAGKPLPTTINEVEQQFGKPSPGALIM